MSTEVTMELLEPILNSIKQGIDSTNKNVIELKSDLKIAEKSINQAISDNRLMDEKIKNIKEQNDKAHQELKDSLSKNWTMTRENRNKIIWWGSAVAGFSAGLSAVFKYLL